MALVRYQPTQLLQQFNNEINRMFTGEWPVSASAQWTPAVDIRESDDGYTIEADVPGINPQAIEVTLDKGVLTLTGERQDAAANDDGAQRHVERSYGRFIRRFSLPDSADADSVQATAENGVLKLVVSKKAASQPRRIAVQG